MGLLFDSLIDMGAQAGRARLVGGAWRDWEIPAGERLYSAAVDDLEEAVAGAHTDLAAFRASIDDAGATSLSVSSGTEIQVEWPAGGWLADLFGFTATTSTTPATAPLPPTGRCQLDTFALSHTVKVVPRSMQLDSDAARLVLVYGVPVESLRVDLQVQGWHGSGVVDDYLRLERWWLGSVQMGLRARYYPAGLAVTSAWDRLAYPLGWREWALPGAAEWAPQPINPRLLHHYRISLDLRAV